MAEDRQSAQAVFDIKYHVIWITKYRCKIPRGRIAERARDLIRQTRQSRDVVVVRGAVSPDHIHRLLAVPAAAVTGETGAVHQKPVVAKTTRGVPGTEEALLGAAFVGTRIPLRDGGRGGRGHHQTLN
jgi:putative transposase